MTNFTTCEPKQDDDIYYFAGMAQSDLGKKYNQRLSNQNTPLPKSIIVGYAFKRLKLFDNVKSLIK